MNEIIKTVLLGDEESGKTKLRRKFLRRGFSANYMMTIGAAFSLKQIKISSGGKIKQIMFKSGMLLLDQCSGKLELFNIEG